MHIIKATYFCFFSSSYNGCAKGFESELVGNLYIFMVQQLSYVKHIHVPHERSLESFIVTDRSQQPIKVCQQMVINK